MRLVSPLMLALLMAAAMASASAQTSTEPPKKDTPAEATQPTTPPATPAPKAATKEVPKLGTTTRVGEAAERSGRVRRAASTRRHWAHRRHVGGPRLVWVYRAHERHGDRHYHLAWRKFGGYFAPGKVRVGAYVLPRRGWCDCRRAHAYSHWH